MSLQFRIADQVLQVNDSRDSTEAVIHKYDAFLNLLCAERYSFQRDAVRETLRFLVSDKYPDLERLARENWNAHEAIRQRHENLDAYLAKMPLRDRKSVSLDLATGTGKSFVMYALAAIALAEGLADRVLVLCPSLTIEEGLLDKFTALAGNSELCGIMQELGAAVAIPGIKRGNETIQLGDICVENIHAVYENTGSSIRDSFRGHGARTLVLNDEAHHLFSPPDRGLKEWMRFLQQADCGFLKIVNVTGTAYVGDEYFPDVVFRYGIKQAIANKVVKRPNYKLEDTYSAHDWQKTYAIHAQNRQDYGKEVKPISIVVTQEIARCVEVWRDLVDFLVMKEEIIHAEAAKKAIWVTSGVPSSGNAKARVVSAYAPRDDRDSPEKRRKENLALLGQVDEAREPEVNFLPQDRHTTEYSTFSETGVMAVEIAHRNLVEIDDALKLMRLFLREKDETIAAAWPKKRLKAFVVSRLQAAGQDDTFLSKENLVRLQQAFGPMFRALDQKHPRLTQIAKEIVPVDLAVVPRQSFSESMLKEHGALWTVKEEPAPYSGQEVHLWEQYQRFRKQYVEYGDEASEQAKAIGSHISQVDLEKFKLPWNVHYVSHEPERKFSALLFENADLFDAFVKMPNTGTYAFPYSYKPATAARTHVANENFNPDFFIKLSAGHDILVVELKADGDDSNRNRAKCRDGLQHFDMLNRRLEAVGEPWRYYFYFLSPEDYTSFFEQVRNRSYAGWWSGLMQEFAASA